MRLLLDVHIGLSMTHAPQTAGHDVVRAGRDFGLWSDVRLLAWACDQQCVLITEDSDFSDLVFVDSHPAPPAIIYLRSGAKALPDLSETVCDVLALDRLLAHIVVIGPTGVRYRPFPGTSENHV